MGSSRTEAPALAAGFGSHRSEAYASEASLWTAVTVRLHGPQPLYDHLAGRVLAGPSPFAQPSLHRSGDRGVSRRSRTDRSFKAYPRHGSSRLRPRAPPTKAGGVPCPLPRHRRRGRGDRSRRRPCAGGRRRGHPQRSADRLDRRRVDWARLGLAIENGIHYPMPRYRRCTSAFAKP